MFVNRKREDRGGKPLLHVGAASDWLSLRYSAFCVIHFESILRGFRELGRFDSVPPGLVSYREKTWSHRFK